MPSLLLSNGPNHLYSALDDNIKGQMMARTLSGRIEAVQVETVRTCGHPLLMHDWCVLSSARFSSLANASQPHSNVIIAGASLGLRTILMHEA